MSFSGFQQVEQTNGEDDTAESDPQSWQGQDDDPFGGDSDSFDFEVDGKKTLVDTGRDLLPIDHDMIGHNKKNNLFMRRDF